MAASSFLNTTHELRCALRETRSSDDLTLLPLLLAASGNRPGTFVEIGANIGTTGSQTWLLEKCFGWSGVLIEADPIMFAQLERAPRSHLTRKVHSAVCDEGVKKIQILGDRRCKGTAAVCRPRIPCQPLPALMAAAGYPRANYLSLDVEGHEELVLRTVVSDQSRPEDFPFDVVLVEIDTTNDAKNERVRSLLRRVGLRQLPHEYYPGSYNDLFARPHLGDPRPPLTPNVTREAYHAMPWLKPLLRAWPHSAEAALIMNRTTTTLLAKRLMVGLPQAYRALKAKHSDGHHQHHHHDIDKETRLQMMT